MRLPVQQFDSKLFTWDAGDFTMSADASDLGAGTFTPIYDDACDVGFSVQSYLSGDVLTFHVQHEQRDAEGDVQWWDLALIAEDLKQRPYLENLRVRVFND